MTQPDAVKNSTSQTNAATKNAVNSTLVFDQSELILPPAGCCFHCGDPVPKPPFTAFVLGEEREMCCMGCQLASESIVEAGLEQYYLDRSEINRTASLPSELERLQAYDHDDIKSQFVYQEEGKSIAELSVNNLRCAACTWLIETRLYELEGISQCQVNLTNQRMRVIWDESKLPISQILKTVSDIGYNAKPYRQDTHEAMLARANKQMIIRLGIAALGAMQAMMYAVGMYFGDYGGMLVEHRHFLRWVSLFVSIPVFFYCAVPFFTSAWSAIKARQVNMDVPVSIALSVTFFASLYTTFTGVGETYYDSVSMFVFFLLAGRYIEHNARLKAANMANDLVVVEPTIVKKIAHKPELVTALYPNAIDATKTQHELNAEQQAFTQKDNKDNKATEVVNDQFSELTSNQLIIDSDILEKLTALGERIHDTRQTELEPDFNNATDTVAATDAKAFTQPSSQVTPSNVANEKVTANSLKVGDVIIIEAGSEVIADGILCSEMATVSQSLLTGESDLIVKSRGDVVIGGSQNDSQPFVMIVTALPENSQIALIDRLMNRAMSEKPKIAEQADKWARWFVARILILSIIVFIGWYLVDPSQAIWATVAVLVATCPCALSLATPIALTVSTNRLASYGFLTTRGHTIQTLAEITHVAFDKTGTLTYGKPNLLFIDTLDHINPIAMHDTQNTGDAPKNSKPTNLKADLSSNTEPTASSLAVASATQPHHAQNPHDQHNPHKPVNKDDLLAIAAALEVGSRHPIATALLDAAYQLHLPKVADLINHPAGGIEGRVKDVGGDSIYRLGHIDFAMQTLRSSDKNDVEVAAKLEQLKPNLSQHQASTAVMLTRRIERSASGDKAGVTDNAYPNTQQTPTWQPLAMFYFNDSIREGMPEMIADLQSRNISTLMLTGDPSEHAQIVANELGVDHMANGLSPTDKVDCIKRLQADGNVVMMVGDGINDAPVLAAANISTAIAGAADLAQVSSDSVILNGAVTAVYDAKRIADKAQQIIKQNLYWALGYNAVVLLPAAFGYVPPWLAAIGMSLSSLLVVLNALRLKRA